MVQWYRAFDNTIMKLIISMITIMKLIGTMNTFMKSMISDHPVVPEDRTYRSVDDDCTPLSCYPALPIQAYCYNVARQERARAAAMNADNNREIVLKYVDSLQEQSGNGVSTKCIVYNATGDTVKHVGDHDWYGNIGPAKYPSQIENGQWGGFLHVKTGGSPSGSVGAVVYRGKNLKDQDCDWMLSWSNPWLRLVHDNRVFTEIRKGVHYDKHYWGLLQSKLKRSGKTHRDNWNECSSSMTSGTGKTVVVEVIMTLDNA